MQIPNCIARLSEFLFGYLVGFILSWRLALSSIPFVLVFIIPGVGFGKILMNIQLKMKDTYGVAGCIAEQALSSVRIVYSYVGETYTLNKYSLALEDCVKFGIKAGFTKGLMIGSSGLMFASWAFLSWVGSILVIDKGESGGHVFISACSIIIAGL